jgi:hypothetical protein
LFAPNSRPIRLAAQLNSQLRTVTNHKPETTPAEKAYQ